MDAGQVDPVTMTTPRGPASTVLRMVANAMHIQNIEVETGWSPDEIKAVAVRNGYALDTFRFEDRRVRPTVTAVVAAPAPVPLPPVSDRPDVQAAWLAFFSAFTELLHAIDGKAPALPAPDMPTKRPGNYPTGPRLTHGASQSQIRDWARTQGLDVNPRGTVRRDIADAYAAAHRQETP